LTDRLYTSRLQKGGALLDDMRTLVRFWKDQGEHRQKEWIVSENILGKHSRTRALDVYQEAFVPRFIKGNPPEAWKIVRPLEDRDLSIEIVRPIYYWITARSEPILYDFVVEEIVPKAKSMDVAVGVDDTERWVQKKSKSQGRSWSRSVSIRVAQSMLAALRDFGILEGKAKKQIAPSYLPVESFAYLAFCLFKSGASGEKLIKHDDWRLFLLNQSVVERLFLDAHQSGFLRYEAAGRIHRLDFFANTMEEMADVIVGRRN